MAIVTAGYTAIDTNDSQIGALALGTAVSATSTYLALRTPGGWLDEFYGTFQYDLFGNLGGGTLNEWRESYNGQLVFDVKGAVVDVASFFQWVATDNNLLASQTVLAGADSITGNVFGDKLSGWAGADVIVGADGNDTEDGGSGADTINGNLGNDVIKDPSGANYLRGDEGDDSITGGSDFDDINGNMGNDTGHGGPGDDWVVGGRDLDLLYGDDGGDIVYGNLGDDTCDGGAGADLLRGGQGDDLVTGGAGNDWLSGDRGNDTITGGAGADTFHTFAGAGIDRVTDFHVSEGDKVQVDAGTTYTVSQVGADTVIDMRNGDQMVLVGVQMTTLPTGWIFTL
jgi:Ca2+-binding RTX toxin-like protein